MRVAKYYSHLNGLEWMKVECPGMWEEINGVIASIDASEHFTKRSLEARMKGQLKYNPRSLNKEFKERFEKLQWKASTVKNWVTDDMKLLRQTVTEPPAQQKKMIEAEKKEPIPSNNQVDFVRDRVAIEVQFGKYSFVAFDMFVKHLAFYVADKIDCGVEILPMKAMQRQMSSGPGYYEWALHNFARQGRGVPAVPLVMIGVEP